MSVKIVKVATDGSYQANDFPRPGDWPVPPEAQNGSVDLFGAPAIAIPVAIGNGTASYIIRPGFAGKVIDMTHAYRGGGHALDVFDLLDSGATRIAAITAGSATVNALVRASVLDSGNNTFAEDEQLTVSVTDGGNDTTGLLTIFCLVNA